MYERERERETGGVRKESERKTEGEKKRKKRELKRQRRTVQEKEGKCM